MKSLVAITKETLVNIPLGVCTLDDMGRVLFTQVISSLPSLLIKGFFELLTSLQLTAINSSSHQKRHHFIAKKGKNRGVYVFVPEMGIP